MQAALCVANDCNMLCELSNIQVQVISNKLSTTKTIDMFRYVLSFNCYARITYDLLIQLLERLSVGKNYRDVTQ